VIDADRLSENSLQQNEVGAIGRTRNEWHTAEYLGRFTPDRERYGPNSSLEHLFHFVVSNTSPRLKSIAGRLNGVHPTCPH
jgi:hypothetical protein